MALFFMSILTLVLLTMMWLYLRAIRAAANDTTARSNAAITELRELRRLSMQLQIASSAERFSEYRYLRLVQILRDAYVAADEVGTIVSWNPAAALMFQRGQDDAVGQHVTILFPERLRGQFREGMAQFLLARPVSVKPEQYFDSVAVDADGDEFQIRIVMWATELPDSVLCNALIHRIAENDERRIARRAGE